MGIQKRQKRLHEKGKRLCGKCKKVKPLSGFTKDKSRTYGLACYCKECQAKYRATRRKEMKESGRRWRDKNPKRAKYNRYRGTAKKRNLAFELTREEFYSFWQKPCAYCGDKIDTVRLDRVDSTKGYVLDNVVSCCPTCNRMKSDLTEEEFIKHCEKVVNFVAGAK